MLAQLSWGKNSYEIFDGCSAFSNELHTSDSEIKNRTEFLFTLAHRPVFSSCIISNLIELQFVRLKHLVSTQGWDWSKRSEPKNEIKWEKECFEFIFLFRFRSKPARFRFYLKNRKIKVKKQNLEKIMERNNTLPNDLKLYETGTLQ